MKGVHLFICQYSGECSKAREKPVTAVVKTRTRKYINYYWEWEGRKKVRKEKISYGTEIVKEIKIREKYKSKIRSK